MLKILFVCHGNICRSPMAEFIMKDKIARAGLGDCFDVASAAVSDEEIGNPVHPGTREKLRQAGISCRGKVARRMTRADYEEYDLIVAMDRSNVRWMNRICGGDPEGKFHLMLEYAGLDRDVADPWYTGDFDATYDDINLGCDAILSAWRDGKLR